MVCYLLVLSFFLSRAKRLGGRAASAGACERRACKSDGVLLFQRRRSLSCHSLPFQPILRNIDFLSELAKTYENSPRSISEGGRTWQVLPVEVKCCIIITCLKMSRTKRPMQHHVAPHRRCRFFVHVPRENAGRNTMSHLTAAGCIAADPLRPAKLAAMTYDCYDCHYMTVMTFPRYDCYDFSLFPFILERLPRLPTPTKLITAFEARTHLVRSFH